MKDLTSDNIRKTYFLFAIPLVLGGLLSQMTGTIDTLIAGRFLGSAGLAATGATGPFITFLSSVTGGLVGGLSAYTAKQFGMGKYAEIKKNIYSNWLLIIGGTAVLSLLSVIFKDPLFRLLHVDPAIHDEASRYFLIYMGCFPLIKAVEVFMNTLFAFGIGGYALVNSIISTVVHIGGNILTVVWLDMGVTGLAVSTVVSCIIVDITLWLKIRACFKEMGVLKLRVKPSFAQIKASAAYTLPTSAQQMSMYLASMILSPMVNAIGATASASYTVMNQIYNILAGVYQNASKTLANLVAQNLGAGKVKNIKRGLYAGLWIGLIFILPLILACVIFPKEVCSLFFQKSYDGADLSYATLFARYFLPLILFNYTANLFHAFYRGTGSMKPLLVATILGSTARILVTYVMMHLGYGMTGMMIGWASSWVVDGGFGLLVYFMNDWNIILNDRANFAK